MRYLKTKAANLFPAYFALVMTSGALSIGTHLLEMFVISKILLYINVVAYVFSWFLTIIRLFNFFPNLVNEDWKSTRLNSSHVAISYAVICLKKKIKNTMSNKQHNEK